MQAIRSQPEQTLLPHMWLRKRWLRRALRDYPMYNPPHKVEERLLSKAQAAQNFEYFMRVRHQRLAYFHGWLRRYFWVALRPDAKGVKALNRWGNKYAGLLLEAEPAGGPTNSYFTYDPPWADSNAGCNVLFDMGITLGEFLIANCPKLYWDIAPTSSILPRAAKMRKREPGMSFQRPEVTGSDNPAWRWPSLHYVHTFAHQMMYLTTHPRACRYYRLNKADRRLTRDSLLNSFTSTLSTYPAFGIDKVLQEMSLSEYLDLVDSEAEQDQDGDE